MSDALVNKTRTGSPQPGIGHNGPPPDIYVREIKKLTAIEAVLKNPKFNQTQALILIGLIVKSDEMYKNAFPGAMTLAVYAKVKRTDAVFKALRDLEDQFKLISRESRGQGRSNSYSVIPQRVMDAVIAAAEERKAAKEAEKAAAATSETHPPKTGDLAKETSTPKAGELPEPTRPKRAPAQTGHPPKAGPTHPPKAGTYPVYDPVDKKGSARPQSQGFWQNALNPSHDVLYEAGKITLLNGMRVHWLEEFEGDERRLRYALDQAAGYIQPNSSIPLEAQVSSQLGRIAGQKLDGDKRHAASAANKSDGKLPAWKADINDKLARMRAANK